MTYFFSAGYYSCPPLIPPNPPKPPNPPENIEFYINNQQKIYEKTLNLVKFIQQFIKYLTFDYFKFDLIYFFYSYSLKILFIKSI